MTRFPLILAATLAVASPAFAQEPVAPPEYLDNRSTGVSTIESLYNAINRREYLRAWSYFEQQDYAALDENAIAEAYATFSVGYAETESVTVLTGPETTEGAAGSTYYTVPVAITATQIDGTSANFAGCYVLRLAEPGIQDAPPFRPLAIESGVLEPAEGSLEAILPTTCATAE